MRKQSQRNYTSRRDEQTTRLRGGGNEASDQSDGQDFSTNQPRESELYQIVVAEDDETAIYASAAQSHQETQSISSIVQSPEQQKTPIKVQYGLARFFQPSTPQTPVLDNITPKKRQRVATDTVKKLVDEYLESKKEEMSQMQIAAEDAKTISTLVKAKLGGRPAKVFERQGNSNRKAKHESPKKLEIPFAVQLKMCEEMKEARKVFADAQSFFREMKKKYKGLKRERLEHILASEGKLRTAVHNEKQRRRYVGKPRGQK